MCLRPTSTAVTTTHVHHKLVLIQPRIRISGCSHLGFLYPRHVNPSCKHRLIFLTLLAIPFKKRTDLDERAQLYRQQLIIDLS